MSIFTKIVLGVNAFNIVFCLYLLGMIAAGAHLPFWPFFILMIISIFTAIDAFTTKK